MMTGSRGFIGKYLYRAITGPAIDTVQEVDPRMGLKCEDIKAKVSMGGVEFIWHLAGVEGAVKQQPLVKVIEQEVTNIEHVMRATLAAKAKLVIFSSTEVYLPVPVKRSEFSSRTAYAAAKRAVEAAVMATGYEDVAILRIGCAGGRRQLPDGGAVLARFVDQAKKEESLTIFNKGESTRCFIHVLDVVEACMGLLDNWQPGIYDITSDGMISIKDLAQIISKKMNVPTKETRPTDVGLESYHEVDAVSHRLEGPEGWKPKHTIEEIVTDALKY